MVFECREFIELPALLKAIVQQPHSNEIQKGVLCIRMILSGISPGGHTRGIFKQMNKILGIVRKSYLLGYDIDLFAAFGSKQQLGFGNAGIGQVIGEFPAGLFIKFLAEIVLIHIQDIGGDPF